MTGQPRKSGIMMKLLIFIPAVRRNPTGFSRRQCLASSPRLLICAATAVRSASRWERTQPTSYSLNGIAQLTSFRSVANCLRLLIQTNTLPLSTANSNSKPNLWFFRSTLSTTWISGLYSWRVAFRIKGRAWRTMLHHCQLLWHSVGNCRNKGCFSSISKEKITGETSRPTLRNAFEHGIVPVVRSKKSAYTLFFNGFVVGYKQYLPSLAQSLSRPSSSKD